MQQPSVFHLQQIDRYSKELSNLKSRLLIVSILRLLSFVMIVAAVYFAVTTGNRVYLYGIVISAVFFVILLRYFAGYRAEKTFVEQLHFINTNEKAISENQDNDFDDGSDHDHDAIYADDLDIYGERSLFHYLNRTTTSHGGQALTRILNSPPLVRKDIEKNQQAVRQLSTQAEHMQFVMARGLTSDIDDADVRGVNNWLHTRTQLIHLKWLKIARFALPIFTIASFIYYLDSDNPIPFGIGVILSWAIVGRFSPYISSQHAHIGRKQAVLQQYSGILKQYLKIDSSSSDLLQDLHETAISGNTAIGSLSRLSSLFDQRLNLLVNVFLNSLFMYDIQCMISLESWKEKHQLHFNTWVEAVGEIEMLISFGTFAFNHPQYSFPVIADGDPVISGTGMAHPLIPAEESVSNDVTAGKDEKLLLITGSNMSGKSTFLRTVGVNLLLAQCGAPVSASKFEFSPMAILSSIRISDSLQEHTSYFMAELKRLKKIIEVLHSQQPSLVLIDEVLRGTNSNDKTHGSESLIRKLIGAKALTFFASHDLSLSALETELPGLLSNYCFESRIENGELLFDYKLHPGVARNKNATFLMQKMGIIS